ncbi:aldehyde dehydrogenase family protein [Marinibactrum halimedae]|uniref:Cyclic nucleotide-binding domain-containing protein n=1 Tax=Marinibactrum halimedae TaxID=1444977 RepID=A0AA37TDI5_9GAMM|nr:aldehyde dehydrogenase family protein [Marinibactrum halimedae]MCD9461009.1 aldehyde dehydrogenase family protein [Marinibactrum halimedae]GLS27805.1 hypothetical protein GCM10007877_35240 [Marinibactrum halimedae]
MNILQFERSGLSVFSKFRKCTFHPGDVICQQGEVLNGCYYIVGGEISGYYEEEEVFARDEIEHYLPGDIVGAVSMLDGEPMAVTLEATKPVTAFYFSLEELQALAYKDIESYREIIQTAAASITKKYRSMHSQIKKETLNNSPSPYIDATVNRAVSAQKSFMSWSEEKLNQLLINIGDAINEEASMLASLCVQETGIGVEEHKVDKIGLGSIAVAEDLVAKPGNGKVTMSSPGVEEVSMPMGVILGLIPVTNPVETITFKSLIALKSRNAIIFSTSRRSEKISHTTVNIIREELRKAGAPVDLVQIPTLAPSRQVTQRFMRHEDVSFILATGGSNMVKAAYQSGTPAIGAGRGNAPVWISNDAHIERAATHIVNSKSFDNGIVCGSENNLLVDIHIARDFRQELIKNGAAILNDAEAKRVRECLFSDGTLKAEWMGQTAGKICAAAEISRSYPIRLIIVDVEAGDFEDPLLREKLVPLLSLVMVEDDQMALHHAKTILAMEGQGHTAIIHSTCEEKVHAFRDCVPVSRVLVNGPGTQGCIGAVNGMELSWTLGCGTLGGGSCSDNVNYQHLQNTKRVAYCLETTV